MTYLEYEPCSKFSGNVGVPDEKVNDPAHYPTARCLSGMHPRSEDHDLFPGVKGVVIRDPPKWNDNFAKTPSFPTHPSRTSSLVFGDDTVST